jgi:hypothetical protein
MRSKKIEKLFKKLDINTEEKRNEFTKFSKEGFSLGEIKETSDEKIVLITAVNTSGEINHGELE